MDISITKSNNNNNNNIYIRNKDNIIKDKLITYLEERRVNKKVSKFFNIFLIFFN